MTVVLVELFGGVEDQDAFLDAYGRTHAPLARKLPGLRALSLERAVADGPLPSAYDVVARLEFGSRDELERALASDAARETERHIRELHEGAIDFCVVEPVEVAV